MERLPARTLKLPSGLVLSNEEIITILTHANQRKAEGMLEPRFTEDLPDLYTLHVPVGIKLAREDVRVAITRLNDAAAHGNADVLLTFQDGRLVKKWVTLKGDAPAHGLVPEFGGRRMKLEF